jgi:hypothetical protein
MLPLTPGIDLPSGSADIVKRRQEEVSMSGAGIVFVTAIVVAALLCLYVVWRQRRNRTKRLIGDLLKEYFEGRMAVEQVGQRGRKVTSSRFPGGPEFFALTHTGFQHAADAKLAQCYVKSLPSATPFRVQYRPSGRDESGRTSSRQSG